MSSISARRSDRKPLAAGNLRVGLADPGSLNLGGVDGDGIPTGGFVYAHSYEAIARAFTTRARAESGDLRARLPAHHARLVARRWLPRGAMLKFYFATERGYLGAPFGLPPTRLSLDPYLAMLEGCDLPWAVSVVGGDVVARDVSPLHDGRAEIAFTPDRLLRRAPTPAMFPRGCAR